MSQARGKGNDDGNGMLVALPWMVNGLVVLILVFGAIRLSDGRDGLVEAIIWMAFSICAAVSFIATRAVAQRVSRRSS